MLKEISFLTFYHFLFFWKFYANPYLLSTSELASTFFPHWIWMGNKWKARDDIYYKYPACIPFLSMFYLPSVIMAKLCSRLSMDMAFRLYIYFILAHYLLASFIAYQLFGIFGAITLTYAGYCVKPQTPAFVFTMCWMPGMLIHGPIGWISCAMAILGGYWPILVYFLPVAAFLNPSCLWGFIPGLFQIIPFLWYWPNSVRAGRKEDTKFGRLPWWKLKDLFIPTNDVAPTNGVHFPEVAMYMGIAPLFIWHQSWWWIPVSLCILILCGAIPSIQRIPCRALYLLTLSIVFLMGEIPLTLGILQAYFLLQNSSIYPSFPFSQWWDKPSKLYARSELGKWPNSTGYLVGRKVSDYKGDFRLKDEYK